MNPRPLGYIYTNNCRTQNKRINTSNKYVECINAALMIYSDSEGNYSTRAVSRYQSCCNQAPKSPKRLACCGHVTLPTSAMVPYGARVVVKMMGKSGMCKKPKKQVQVIICGTKVHKCPQKTHSGKHQNLKHNQTLYQNNLKTSNTKLLKNLEVGFNIYRLHGSMGSTSK